MNKENEKNKLMMNNNIKLAQADINDIDKSIRLCLYTMKTQVFIDGNKRAAIIYANHYLIAHGQGFLVIPAKHFDRDPSIDAYVRMYETLVNSERI